MNFEEPNKRRSVDARVESDVYEEIERIAKLHKVRMSAVVRKFIDIGLEAYKKEQS